MVKTELTEIQCLEGLDRLGLLSPEGKEHLKELTLQAMDEQEEKALAEHERY